MSPPAATTIHHPVEGERPGFAIRILVPLSLVPLSLKSSLSSFLHGPRQRRKFSYVASGFTRRSGLARTPTVALLWQQSDSEPVAQSHCDPDLEHGRSMVTARTVTRVIEASCEKGRVSQWTQTAVLQALSQHCDSAF